MTRKIDRYEILGEIATGGMAEILLARLVGPSGFERPVVIKRIRSDLDHAELTEFFLEEARLAARVQHANVVHVEDLGTDEGSPYIVMEYVDGESLANLARRLVARGERLAHPVAAFIVAQASAGLHAAHELSDGDGRPVGLVHRDVSPQNILVGYTGAVKVVDFGIAKTTSSENTDGGQLRGKWGYMAPEQLTRGTLDRRTDVFALGIVLYELVTGHRLFKRFSPTATVNAVLREPILPPGRVEPSVPAPLAAICMRALSRAPEERYATAADMRRELLAALRSLGSDEPEAELAATMMRCFPERIEDKKVLLRDVREGSVITKLPAADVDITIEIPGVEESDPDLADAPPPSLPSVTTSAPLATVQAPPRRSSAALFLVPLVLLAGGGVAFAIHAAQGSADANAAVPVEAPPAASTAAVAAPTASAAESAAAAPVIVVPVESSSAGPRTVTGPATGAIRRPAPRSAAATAATTAPEAPIAPPSASARGFRRFP